MLKNLRVGITHIVKRHTNVNINNNEQTTASKEGIYYLDANNLYGGAMHRMMPYELVDVAEREELMEKINRDPDRWVQSLKTFGKYRFFIEVDKVKETNTPKLICDLVPRSKYLVHYSLLQLNIQQGYRVTHVHHLVSSKHRSSSNI